MYHSNLLYTGSTGLSNCILGMSNLTACIYIHNMVHLGKEFPQNISFEVYLLVGTLWHLYETSEIRVVHGELGVNSTSLRHR